MVISALVSIYYRIPVTVLMKLCIWLNKQNQFLQGDMTIFNIVFVGNTSIPILHKKLLWSIFFLKLQASSFCIWSTVKLATFVWFFRFFLFFLCGNWLCYKTEKKSLSLHPSLPASSYSPSPSVSLAGFPLFFCLAVGETKGTKEREETVSSSSTVVCAGVGLSIESWTDWADWSYEN